MSAIKAHLHALADQAGMTVGQYLYRLAEERRLEREYEEWKFHKSINDGSYFDQGYKEGENVAE